MRTFLLILLLLAQNIVSGKQPNVLEMREIYYKSYDNLKDATRFYKLMAAIDSNAEPIIICYRGMSNMLLSKLSLNPINKYNYFRKGRELIDRAINKDKSDIEMRFMRFCIQTNIPAILHYNCDLDADKNIILKGWQALKDKDLKNKIKLYMIQSEYCSQREKLTFT